MVGAKRLDLGEALEALGIGGGHHELGFSSFGAYAIERCEKSGRWVADTRAMARRLAGLPLLREALRAGRVGWSAAELLSRHCDVDEQQELLALAKDSTVRQLRELLCDGKERQRAKRTLTVTVSQQDSWLLEATKMLLRHLGAGLSDSQQLEVLLAEGMTTLLAATKPDTRLVAGSGHGEALPLDELLDCAPFGDGEGEQQHRQWLAMLVGWRQQAEHRCEGRIEQLEVEGLEVQQPEPLPTEPVKLDGVIRRLARELLRRDLQLGDGLRRLLAANGWRRLGYGSFSQYCRERLGLSRSSVKARLTLSRRAERLPTLRAALEQGAIGFEAAMLVGRVANAETVDAWVGRATERTFKHLHEEVAVAELYERMQCRGGQKPPDDQQLQKVQKLESDIISGRLIREALSGGETDPGQMSGGSNDPDAPARRGAGKITLRWHVTDEVYRTWYALLQLYCRSSQWRGSFVEVLCVAVWHAWQHTLGSDVAYADIYERDRWQCSNPVCFCRHVTPHHVRFRSQGGDDSPHNITPPCFWCHLDGIHGGRIKVTGEAPNDLRWVLGRQPVLEVHGRTRTER